MSFILDALKKSESDRQQKASPGIADVPTASQPGATSRWIPILAALLAVNLAVVLYVVFRPSPTAAPVASSAVAPLRSQTAPVGRSDDGPRQAASPAIADDSASEPAIAESAVPEPTPDPSAPAPRTIEDAIPETVPATNAPQASETPVDVPVEPAEDETYLTLNDLRASGKLDLPEMHIDLHVYSSNPAERFVFINMNQYRENAVTEEGPRVRRITTEGVLLEYRGSAFLLPRD